MGAASRTHDAIADELGLRTPRTVYAIVRKALAAQEVNEAENLRELEAARLDRLQQALQV